MKILFDLFPIILFFVAFKARGIYVATAAAIAACVVQIAYVYLRHRKVEPMLWVSLGVVVVFGGATLFFRNPTFIKWKPTVLYLIFSAVLAIGDLFLNKNPIKALLQKQMALPDPLWRKMNLSWAGFFAFLAVANVVAAHALSTDAWVNYKLFGTMGLMLAFAVAQGLIISRAATPPKQGE